MDWVWWFWFLATVLELLILGGLGMLLVQGKIGQPREHRPDPRVSARHILDDRLAHGEIDAEEYQRRKAELP